MALVQAYMWDGKSYVPVGPDSPGWVCEGFHEEEPTKPGLDCVKPESPVADILADAIKRAEAMLPHGIELRCERNVSHRTYDFAATCPHCRTSAVVSSFSDWFVEESGVPNGALASHVAQGVRNVMPSCISATCCDPMDRLVDSHSVRWCLEQYQAMQRADAHAYRVTPSIGGPDCVYVFGEMPPELTQAQNEAARDAWSAQLSAKQQESKERERVAVTVDDDRWEP